MSMYLFDEQLIIANKALARVLELNGDLVLQQINYWIEINKKSGKTIMMRNIEHTIPMKLQEKKRTLQHFSI